MPDHRFTPRRLIQSPGFAAAVAILGIAAGRSLTHAIHGPAAPGRPAIACLGGLAVAGAAALACWIHAGRTPAAVPVAVRRTD